MASMEKKYCPFCRASTWHNPKKKVGEFRCTKCGK